jgi:hypothetical protein
MQNYPNKTKEMFIVRALEKILADKDIKRQGQLKKSCESAIATLKGWTFLNSYNALLIFLCYTFLLSFLQFAVFSRNVN